MTHDRPQDVPQGGRRRPWRPPALAVAGLGGRPAAGRRRGRLEEGVHARRRDQGARPARPSSCSRRRLRGGRADQPQPARPRRGPRRPRQDRAWSSTASAAAGTGRTRSPTPIPRSSSAGWPRSGRSSSTARPTAAPPSWSSRPSSTRRSPTATPTTRSQENIRKLIPDAEQAGVKIAIEEVWNKFLLSPVEFARYIDEFESPCGRRLLRRRQRRRVRLSRGMDPRAGQADPQDPHQGVRQAQAVRLQARRGRDRLAGRPPGPHRRRLRGLDHRRGRLRRPRRDEGRRASGCGGSWIIEQGVEDAFARLLIRHSPAPIARRTRSRTPSIGIDSADPGCRRPRSGAGDRVGSGALESVTPLHDRGVERDHVEEGAEPHLLGDQPADHSTLRPGELRVEEKLARVIARLAVDVDGPGVVGGRRSSSQNG